MRLELSPDDLRPLVEAVVEQTIRELASSGLLQSRPGGRPSSGTDDPEVLAVKHDRAAEMFEVSPRTLANWERAGLIKAVRPGGVKRFCIADLKKLLEEQQQAGPPEGVGGNLNHDGRPPPT